MFATRDGGVAELPRRERPIESTPHRLRAGRWRSSGVSSLDRSIGRPASTRFLLHGVLQSGEGMRHLAEQLSLDREVLVPDLRGRDSDRPEGGYDLATMADDVAGLIERLGIERPALIGRLHGGSSPTTLLRGDPSSCVGSSWVTPTRSYRGSCGASTGCRQLAAAGVCLTCGRHSVL